MYKKLAAFFMCMNLGGYAYGQNVPAMCTENCFQTLRMSNAPGSSYPLQGLNNVTLNANVTCDVYVCEGPSSSNPSIALCISCTGPNGSLLQRNVQYQNIQWPLYQQNVSANEGVIYSTIFVPGFRFEVGTDAQGLWVEAELIGCTNCGGPVTLRRKLPQGAERKERTGTDRTREDGTRDEKREEERARDDRTRDVRREEERR